MTGGIIELKEGYIDWSLYTETEVDEDGEEYVGEEYVKIDNLVVYPEHRGQGFARLLLTQALETIKKQTPDLSIKIVPQPKDKSTDQSRLADFYASFTDLEVVCY
jgi:predicted GNAT family N-acyltransferase